MQESHNYHMSHRIRIECRHASCNENSDVTSDRTFNGNLPFSSTHSYASIDRFPSRRMKERINNNDPALLEEMKYERRRLSSYATWPRDTNIAPEALARAGLFYLCRADRVKCTFCFGILRNWAPFEDPMRKHRQLFPRCPFVRNPGTTDNVAIGDEPPIERIFNATCITPNTTSTELVGVEIARPKHQTMAVEAERLTTYQGWLPSSHGSPEILARAGFFYKGVSDEVCCFFCGGYLARWQTDDDPVTKHHHYYPNCGFVKLIIEDLTDRPYDDAQRNQNPAEGSVVATVDRDQQHDDATPQSTKMTCPVCRDAEKNVIFLPCRHLACCANCVSDSSTCPVCGSVTQSYFRAYF